MHRRCCDRTKPARVRIISASRKRFPARKALACVKRPATPFASANGAGVEPNGCGAVAGKSAAANFLLGPKTETATKRVAAKRMTNHRFASAVASPARNVRLLSFIFAPQNRSSVGENAGCNAPAYRERRDRRRAPSECLSAVSGSAGRRVAPEAAQCACQRTGARCNSGTAMDLPPTLCFVSPACWPLRRVLLPLWQPRGSSRHQRAVSAEGRPAAGRAAWSKRECGSRKGS